MRARGSFAGKGPGAWAPRRVPSRATVDGEFHQVVVGIAEVDARRRAARARSRARPHLGLDAALCEQVEYFLDAPFPLEAKIGAANGGVPRTMVARLRGRLGAMH